jgi:uncharacterized protein
MEFVFALAIFLIAVLGLGAGLMLTGRPLKGSCGGLACVGGASCDGCPRRATETGETHDD